MDVTLESIQDCFEGVIPSLIATVDDVGIPNVSYLSHVYYVDRDHVALSNQFFTKTAANVRSNRQAVAVVVDGRTGEQYLLDLFFEEGQTDGPVFERMAAQLHVMSSQHGMESLMALRSADLYRVIECRSVPAPGGRWLGCRNYLRTGLRRRPACPQGSGTRLTWMRCSTTRLKDWIRSSAFTTPWCS